MTRGAKASALLGAGVVLAGLGLSELRGAATAAPDVDWDAVSREAVDLLQRYVRLRSVNPPADTTATAAFLEEILEKEGIEVKTFTSAPGKVNLLARLPATVPGAGDAPKGAVLLLHHMDVVPVDAARWPVDPFGAEIREGALYGRGAMDMKGIGVIHLMALLTLHRQRVPLARDVLLLATPDEETGGQDGARWMIANHWDDMRPEYVFDEGGFGSRDVLAADGRLAFAVSVAEKKIVWGRLRAEGTAGHASQPTPDNPNDLLVKAIRAVRSRPIGVRPPPPSAVVEMKSRLGELASNKYTHAIQSDTMSLTSLRSGLGDPPKVNVIPSWAEATFDFRLLPDTDPDRFMEEARGRMSALTGVKLEATYRMDDAPVTPWDTPMFLALERAIVAEHPGAVVTPSLIPYGTDSNAFRVKGAKAYGIAPMVVDASIVASMHSDAERVPVDQLGPGARIFYRMLKEFCGG